jgi:hypothetical protein
VGGRDPSAPRLLGINPFDQPDVESAKRRPAACSTPPEPTAGIAGRRAVELAVDRLLPDGVTTWPAP